MAGGSDRDDRELRAQGAGEVLDIVRIAGQHHGLAARRQNGDRCVYDVHRPRQAQQPASRVSRAFVESDHFASAQKAPELRLAR